MSTRIRYCTTTCLCDSNTRCRCSVKRTCSPSGQTPMARTTRAARSQTAPCRTQSTPQWTTAAWISLLDSNGKPTCRINLIRCKRDTQRVRRARPSPLEGPKWCPHRKITGVLGAALVGRMAQLRLLATFATVGTTHVARRYPALARRPTQPDWCTTECTADRSHRRTPHQSQASVLPRHQGLRVPAAPSRAKVVHPRHAPIASPKPRLCGAVILKGIPYATHVVCS